MSSTPDRIDGAPSPDQERVENLDADELNQDDLDVDADEDGFDEDGVADDEYSSGVRSTIRAKWSMDGATTLTEAAELLRHFADELVAMEADGWQLTQPVQDDYGFIRRPPAPGLHQLTLRPLPLALVHLVGPTWAR